MRAKSSQSCSRREGTLPGARRLVPWDRVDLLVKIEAASVNPVDVKTRGQVPVDKKDATILGFDGAGIVESVGSDVKNFKPGDEVFYAGTLVRPGNMTYAEPVLRPLPFGRL